MPAYAASRSTATAASRRRPAERTSLQLVGVDLEQVARGHELTAPGVYRATTSLLVRCRLLATAPEPLDGSSPVRLHVNAAQRIGKLRPLDAARLMPGQEAVAEIRLDEPLVAVRGDRFVIRRPSPQTTLGGGDVLDPAWRRPRGKALGPTIDALGSGDRQAAAVQWAADSREAGLAVTELALRLGVVPADARQVLNGAAQAGLLLEAGAGGRFVTAATVRRVTRRARRLVEAHFAADRLSRGMPKAELVRRLLGARAADLAPAYLDWSSRGGKDLSVVTDGELVTLPDRTSELTGAESKLARDIVEGFEAQGLTPGSPEELCRTIGAKPQVFEGVLRYLVERGKLARLPNGLVLAASSLERFQADLLATGWDTFTVADFKDRFGLTRKWAIPLLEHLDRQRLTRREGDRRRVLRPRHRMEA